MEQTQSDFYSLKEMLDEYFVRLQSSRSKDPKTNELFQDIKNKLAIVGTGQNKIDLYEKYLPLRFYDFWKEFLFDKFLEEYIEEFNVRLQSSTDRDRLFEIETKSIDKYDLNNNLLSNDIRADGEKLGFSMAVNGDNPTVFQLIHHLTKYEFGLEVYLTLDRADFFKEDYWERVFNSYQQIFQKLHWVCVGYLKAKKVEYIRELKERKLCNSLGSTPNAEIAEKLTNKQQVLLLHKLGVFDLEIVQKLSVQNQGKLFGRLFGKSEKNTEDYIRYRKGKNPDQKHSLQLKSVQSGVNRLLEEVGLKI